MSCRPAVSEACSSSDAGWVAALLLGLAVGAVAAAGFVAQRYRAHPFTVRLLRLLRRGVASVGAISPKLKLIVGFYQVAQA